MSRLHRLFHSVASGYAVLLANIVFSLAQIPLALSYLNESEFGLWVLTIQLSAYLQLIDFGMSSSVSRLLIDHKHEPNSGPYGSTIQTGFLVLVVQGFIILFGGVALTFGLSQWLNLPSYLLTSFKLLMTGQCVLLALSYFTKIFSHVLTAHQRLDVTNYSQIGLFLINYLVQWFCFHLSLGVFSLLWANAAGLLLSVIISAGACVQFKFFPAKGGWAKPTRERFNEIFSFGKDVFWVALGAQLIVASQTIIITRALGLNAAATWSICTRTYNMVTQLVWRPFDYSYPALAEMIVLNERARLHSRLKSLVVVSSSLAVLGGTIYTVCNQPFIALWTQGKIGWPVQNDALLAVWLLLSTLVHCLCGFALTTKMVGFMRYIYFIEGVAFAVAGTLVAGFGGFTALILASIVCTSLFTLPYGIWRTIDYFRVPGREIIFDWMMPPIRLLLIFTPIAAALWYACLHFDPAMQVFIEIPILGCLGIVLLLRCGIHGELKEEISVRASPRFRRLLETIIGDKSKHNSSLPTS